MRAFGQPGAGGAQLLGILPVAERSDARPGANEEVRIPMCPSRYASEAGEGYASSPSSPGAIPLLDGLDP